MKRYKITNQEERLIATGIIVSDTVCAAIANSFDAEIFDSQYVRTITGLAMDYFKEHKEAPRAHIMDLFATLQERTDVEEKEKENIESLLEDLNTRYLKNKEKFNSKYIAQEALKFVEARMLRQAARQTLELLGEGKMEEAKASLVNYKAVSATSSTTIDPFTDKDVIFNAFEETSTPLLRFKGPLGHFINNLFCRGSFVAFMGPEKRGKTFWLAEVALRALKWKNNVAFFTAGDMTASQMTKRFLIRLAGRSDKPRYCGPMLIPVLDCLCNQMGTCTKSTKDYPPLIDDTEEGGTKKYHITRDTKPSELPKDYRACSKCSHLQEFRGAVWYEARPEVAPLDWRSAIRAGRTFARYTRNRKLKLQEYHQGQLTVKVIESHLEIWQSQEGWVPDVIVIDYADIMGAEDHAQRDERHKQNDRWKALRRLSTKYNVAVVTATQADADSYDAAVLHESNFSEDKRKYSHVTGIITLNQLPEDKAAGIMRIGTMFLRDDDYDSSRVVHVLQCLAMGRPCLASYEEPR